MLIDLYSLVENVIASAFVIGGIALTVNSSITRSLFDTFTDIENNAGLIYLTAWMFLMLGLITVWVHTDWYFSYSILITLFGWILVVKASLWLLFPRLIIRFAKKLSFIVKSQWFHIVYGLTLLLIGLFIFIKQNIDKLPL
ncbi:MAG: hypothetical protein OXN83_02060 [Oligoflexia bacterium]|nr:hypothetical protein [Oligoflexia bacterium]